MTPLELVFTMLGEVSTKEIAVTQDARGFIRNLDAAKEGGRIAGDARKHLESKTGKRVVSEGNYLSITNKMDPKKAITEE